MFCLYGCYDIAFNIRADLNLGDLKAVWKEMLLIQNRFCFQFLKDHKNSLNLITLTKMFVSF